MLRRFRHYLISLATLSLMALVYLQLVEPWMQPPAVQQVKMAVAAALRSDDSLADLFPPDAWQRGPCKRLQTSEGILLFDRMEQTADDQWKLWPVTVVIGRGLSGVTDREPILIESSEGAEIKFAESLDVMSGGAPRIHRGRIIGEVRIRRLRSATGGAHEHSATRLDIRTANVGIDNRKIWTTEAIDMRIGDAHLVGRDLTLHLTAATGSVDPPSDAAAVLDRMELIYLDKLTMPLVDGVEGTRVFEAADKLATALPDVATMISVACGGRVEYDFALDRLLLRDDVSLIHQPPRQEADRFDCQSLELSLRDPMNDQIHRAGPMDWISRVRAAGAPAIARLPSRGVEIAAESIELDAVKGLIRADAGGGVRMKYGEIYARLSQLEYHFDPLNPTAIGTVVAQKSGWVKIEDPEIPVRQVQWTEGFEMRPMRSRAEGQPGGEVEVFLDGEVSALLADGGEFQADKIYGVLQPDGSDEASGVQAATVTPTLETSLRPQRFRADGHVRLDATAIAVKTERLMLYFVDDPEPKPDRLAAEDNASGSLRQWVSQPEAAAGATKSPIARPRPELSGDLIKAVLRLNDSGVSAKELSVLGNVEVVHSIQAGGAPLDARLSGEQLVLQDGGGEDILQIGSGPHSPARFELGDGYFEGPEIQIRPSDNIIWINAAGSFQMPTAVLPTGLSGAPPDAGDDAAASKVRWTQSPRCRWQGEMIFDGRAVTLSEGVDITASLIHGNEPWEIFLKGDRLEVILDEDVRLREVQTIRQASVQQVVLMQSEERPVSVEAFRRGADGALAARHLMSAPKLTLLPAAGGKLRGEGPGWYRAWIASATPRDDSAVNAATPLVPGEKGITGIHLMYHEAMQGEFAAKSLEFLRGVRVASKSLDDWTAVVDARAMDTVGFGESALDCDRLRFAVDPRYTITRSRSSGAPTPWEMEASGGVVFRTRGERGLIDGTASRAAYASSKSIFTVQGAVNRPAIFRQTHANGQPGPEVAVKTMTINTESMELQQMVPERMTIPNPNQR